MLYDFAIEPKLFSTWHDKKQFLFFDEKFSIKSQRIIAVYPENWIDEIWKSFREGDSWQDHKAKRKLQDLVEHMKKNKSLVKRRDSFYEITTWLEKTVKEDQERPFRGIIATRNPTENNKVIEVSSLLKNGHEHWDIPEDGPVKRNADELAIAISPILKYSTRFVFVDPYFDPSKPRFRKPMRTYFNIIWNHRYSTTEPEVELHISIDVYFKSYEKWSDRKPKCEQNVRNNLIQKMQNELPKIIPNGKSVSFVIWAEIKNGEGLHNRYILTDMCGILMPAGLDQSNDQQEKKTDDLRLLSDKQRKARWNHYKRQPYAFKKIAGPIVIDGAV